MKAFRRTLSVLLSICMVVTMMVPAFAVQSAGQAQENVDTTSVSAVDGYDYSIVMVDAGRKYYSVDSLKSIIDSASSAGMHYVMLGLGNEGLRFLLDDMSLTVGDTTYTSEEVSTAIHAGNEAYSDFEVDELTEGDMDQIMAYAGTKGVEIIPMINTPGHMNAILDTAEALTGVLCAYGTSQRTIDVTNETATAFTQALLQKYITYFASKGCTLFNMGCDEYANDNGMGFDALVSSGEYGYFVEYVNQVASMVKKAGMTPMAFNDGIYYNETTSKGTFDTDIIICYWSSGWSGYDVAPASFLAEQGHQLVNTHGDWYWIVGDKKCTVEKASQFDIHTFQGGTIEDPAGAMFCIWSDNPQAETDASVAQQVADVISTFGSTLPETSERYVHDTVGNDGTGNAADNIVVSESIILEMDETESRLLAGELTVNPGYNEQVVQVDTEVAPGTEEKITYTKVSNVTYNDLINRDYTSWMDTGYYYTPDGGVNYYPLYAMRSSSGFLLRWYTYTWGYLKDTSVTQFGADNNVRNTSDTPEITVYKQNVTPAEEAHTTVTFTGLTPGETYVTVGETTYRITVSTFSGTGEVLVPPGEQIHLDGTGLPSGATLTNFQSDSPNYATVDESTGVVTGVALGRANVTADVMKGETLVGTYAWWVTVAEEDLNKVQPLSIEYWITNARTKYSNQNFYSVSALQAHSEDGITLQTVLPEKTIKDNLYEVFFWRCRLLDTTKANNSTSGTEAQTGGSGDDDTLSGVGFTKVRYYGGYWQVFTQDSEWVTVTDNHQLVAYYLEFLGVTDEVDSYAADWGKRGDGTNGSGTFLNPDEVCTVSFQVVYEDGSTNPVDATATYLANKTICYGFWPEAGKRGIGTVVLDEVGNYQIYKVTAETGSMTGVGSGNNTPYTVTSFAWDNNPVTVWEGTSNGQVILHNNANGPSSEGVNANLMWDENYESILLRIYVRTKPTEDSLTVHYVDEVTNKDFYAYNINVASGITFDKDIALSKENWKGPLENATVENTLGVERTVTADMGELPEISGYYRYSDYTCTQVVRSEDGREVFLYYTFKNSHAFVVDYGLPLNIQASDLGLTQGDWTDASVTEAQYGDASVTVGQGMTYTPTSTMKSWERLELKLEGENGYRTHTIYIIPATLVYYGANDTFCDFTGEWKQTQTGPIETDEEGHSTPLMQKVVRYASSSNIDDLRAAENNYGYDDVYREKDSYDVMTASQAGSYVSFSFTGDGVDIYADTVTEGANVMVWVKGAGGVSEKILTINTSVLSGDTGATSYVDAYKSAPIASIDGLTPGTHTVEIHIIKNGTFNFAGFRVHNTITNNENIQKTYEIVLEDNPSYIELRDGALTGVTIPEGGISSDQVLDKVDGNLTDVLVLGTENSPLNDAELTDLLNNGPKNELFVTKDYSVSFTLNSERTAQIGLHSATGETVKYQINHGVEQTLNSSVDMFYDLPVSDKGNYTITVTEGVLSITDIKVTGSKSAQAALAPITREAVAHAMVCMGYGADKSVLEDLVSKAEGMDLTGYTAESVDAFRKALTNAQAVLADDALMKEDQQLVDDTVAALTAALDGLTVETEPQPSQNPEVSQKPEATQAPEVTQKPEETQQPQATKKPEGVPQTGDNAPLALSTLMLVGSAVCVLALAVAGVKRRRS